jgi:hypothetical protein
LKVQHGQDLLLFILVYWFAANMTVMKR